METVFDGLIDSQIDSYQRVKRRNLVNGFRDFLDGDLTRQEERIIGRSLKHRLHGEEPYRSEIGFPLMGLLSELLNPSPEKGRIDFDQLTWQDKKSFVAQVVAISKAHLHLMTQATPVQASGLAVRYGPTWWEGIAGVQFYADDPECGQMPFYIMRGNPTLTQNGPCFSIRSVQPWVSEAEPSVSCLKNEDYWEGSNAKMDGKIREVFDFLKRRERMLDKFETSMRKGDSLSQQPKTLTRQEIFLYLGIAYLQKMGVKTIEGIAQKFHPEAYNKEGVSFDYDALFSGVFDKQDKEMYPWVLHNNGLCAIPSYYQLPDGLRTAIIQLWDTK